MEISPNVIIHFIIISLTNDIASENEYNISGIRIDGQPKLARYAIMSRQWQAIVQRIIWQQISVFKLDSVEKLRQFTSGDPY